jgi:hypothetical protein
VQTIVARFGRTPPKRATTSLAASVDQTEARNARHDRDRPARGFTDEEDRRVCGEAAGPSWSDTFSASAVAQVRMMASSSACIRRTSTLATAFGIELVPEPPQTGVEGQVVPLRAELRHPAVLFADC